MTKHTEGPWKVELLAKDDVRVTAGMRHTVAVIPADDTDERHGRIYEFVSREGRANAQIIAAAPDLLDIVRCFVRAAEKEGWSDDSGLLRDAANALRKAGAL